MLITAVLTAASTRAKPLKVFILAGQPNREGHAEIGTFDYIGDDPAPAPRLKQMRGADGRGLRRWLVCAAGFQNIARK